jgi:hypothetical protein
MMARHNEQRKSSGRPKQLPGRAHSLGHARQHLNLLGYALMVNSVALHDHALRRVGPLPNTV